jgi:hypothetical protein
MNRDVDQYFHPVENPAHYNQHPSGVECVTIAQEFSYNLGCAIKYIWRAGLKATDPIEDLRKAHKYIEFEIKRLSRKIEQYEMK